ncbi:MAG TPA: TetR/AcrR family transcriptional regulator C-terminal domain-containing protein [Candidatus Limnocylindrales bacterium]|nr:TetR/AcrR family transcriptional regulator C-terminal domain-containing protein [Candidatus Limnocylindrales bacterium]
MASTDPRPESRIPLSRDRVLRTAMEMADEGGLATLTMRGLGQALGVEAMALYRHVANKSDLIDAMVDLVFSEIELPVAGADWRIEMRKRAVSVREVLSRHHWAVGVMESRRHPGPSNLRHHDAVIGCLLAGGFDMTMAAHAYSVLDSYTYGFAQTQMNLPFGAGSQDVQETARRMLTPFPVDEYPNLVAFITDHATNPDYDYGDEFQYGLDLILDGIARDRPRA